MFDFSWGEVLLIGAVALIVIGPKDLPAALRTVGRMIGRVKRMASEFQGQFNEALREADLDKVRKDVEGMNKTASSGFNPVKSIRDEMKGAIEKPGTAAAGAATMAAPNASASSAAAFAGTKVGAPKVEAVASSPSGAVEPDPPAVQAQAPEQPKSKTTAKPATKPKAKTKAEPEAAPAKKPAPKPASKAPSKPRSKPATQAAAEAPAKKSAAASRKKEEKQT